MTRNCPHPQYHLPSIFSFFNATQKLHSGIIVHTISGNYPGKLSIALIDLESLTAEKKRTSGLLSQDESELFASFSYIKRKKEWLGGRIAAKTALLQLLRNELTAENFTGLSIMPRENGSPEIRSTTPTNFTPAISISHSKKFAVAMATDTPNCGIDIQKISEQTLRVVSKFATPTERQILKSKLPDLAAPQRLSLLWSAKEAVKKAFLDDQPVIFQGIELRDLYCDDVLHFHLNIDNEERLLTVDGVLLDEYALAFTTQPKLHA